MCKKPCVVGGWMDGWMDGWKDGKAGLKIAYSNQKRQLKDPNCRFISKESIYLDFFDQI